MQRWAARIDKAQPDIVKNLRDMGYSVATGKDDILVGAIVDDIPRTFWYEIKTPTKTGKQPSAKSGQMKRTKDKQLEIKATWRGHYRIVSTLGEILEDLK